MVFSESAMSSERGSFLASIWSVLELIAPVSFIGLTGLVALEETLPAFDRVAVKPIGSTVALRKPSRGGTP